MGETTSISWTDATWNPWTGCQKVSPGCDGCYAEHLMERRYGRVEWGPHGERRQAANRTFRLPYRLDRKAAKRGERPFVFPLSLGDIFDNRAPEPLRRAVFDVMRETPNLLYLALTKRPGNIIPMAEAAGGLPPNVALGTSCEDQVRFDQRMPQLVEAQGALESAFLFVSIEPFLSEIDASRHIDQLQWIITGGPTNQGPYKAPPLNPRWAVQLRDQAAAAGVAFHHKQNGEWLPAEDAKRLGVKGSETVHPWKWGPAMVRVGRRQAGRLLEGRVYDARPEAARLAT